MLRNIIETAIGAATIAVGGHIIFLPSQPLWANFLAFFLIICGIDLIKDNA